MTKHPSVHEEALKNTLAIEDVKIRVVSKMVDNSLDIGGSPIVPKAKNKLNHRLPKTKAAPKRVSRLCRATQHLYDLEDTHGPEKPLNIDLDLYQMEDY